MTTIPRFALSVLVVSLSLGAQAPQHLVVPAAFASHDAVSYQWIAGASRDVRQQTLIAENKIAPLVGQRLRAIELRRSATNAAFPGGVASMTVTLSTSPLTPLTCSTQFAANVGSDAVQVFAGPVVLPASPAAPGPKVDWSAENVVRIVFTEPFHYQGGTLCIDVIGAPVPGQNADDWMADAEFQDLKGSFVDLGGGCGTYGGTEKTWSALAERSLVPGSHAEFWAYGLPNHLALVMFGTRSAAGFPMSALGFGVPAQCELHLGSLFFTQLTVFVPETEPLLVSRGHRGDLVMKLGTDASFLGLVCTTQWLDLMTMHTSNALQWTASTTVPTLGMALNEGHPNEAEGLVSVHLAHVMRFEY